MSVFDNWLNILNGNGAKYIADAAAVVHDNLWTAQKIVESRFGEKAAQNPEIVLPVLSLLTEQERKNECRGGDREVSYLKSE